MDSPRDIQHFKRNIATRSTVSSCSSLAMEIKRKKIRESMFFQNEVSFFVLLKFTLWFFMSEMWLLLFKTNRLIK